jgi:hypothetical protein
VGDVSWHKVLSILAITASLSVPAKAQGSGEHLDHDAERFLYSVELIASMAATLHVLSWRCQLGNPEAWTQVIDAVDRRYRRCVPLGSPLEQAVARQFSSQWTYALAAGTSLDVGTLAWEKWLPVRSRRVMSDYLADGCAKIASSPTFKAVLDPNSATPRQREAALEEEREEIRTHLDNLWTFSRFAYVRELGVDQNWVEAPCDAFFPERSGK